MNAPTLVEWPPLPSTISTLSDVESARIKARYPGVVTSTPDDCLTCGGKREFTWRGADGEPVSYRCPCEDQWVLSRFLLSRGIKINYQKLGWGDVEGTEPGGLSLVQGFLSDAKFNISVGNGITLRGSMGTGKTLLACLALKTLLGHGFDGYFITWEELLRVRGDAFDDADARDWFNARIRSARVLVIDELGRSNTGDGTKTSGFIRTVADDVLRNRVANQMTTIITTNLTPSQMSADYGSNWISLLEEVNSGHEYNFTAESFRGRAAERTRTERELGLLRPVTLG